jgi:hypothetical protein
VYLTVDENEIFDPGGDQDNVFPFEDVENSPGYFGVDPLNAEHAATDQDLADILDQDYIPKDRLPYFLRLLHIYRDRFTRSFYGEVWKGGTHEINLMPGTSPYKGRSFRFSKEHMEVLKKLLEKWLDEGVCVPSNSSWGSPAFFVPKKETTTHGARTTKLAGWIGDYNLSKANFSDSQRK